MTEQQARLESREVSADSAQIVPKKKKASWVRTILWILSMMLLANLAMAIVAYFMFFHDK